MRPLRNTPRRQRSAPFTLPVPIGGLNGRDALADMPASDAFVLDNWFPDNTKMTSRKGFASHVTGVGATIESLETYAGGSSSKMLAFAAGSVYDVTTAGIVGAAIAAGKTGNEIVTTMFSNAGNQYLIGCSGADPTFQYDGTTFSTTAITGITGSASTLRCPCTFKGRLLFAQTGSLGFYYLIVGAIAGAASYFDLSQIAKNGGYVTSIATFSVDTGTGPDDFVVFMTTKGEYLVYKGTDPSSAANFALAGRYYAPAPIGRKGWFNFKGDLFIIAKSGILPFSVIRQTGATDENARALSAKLGKAFTALSAQYFGTQGWAGVVYPAANMLVINAPASDLVTGTYYQFVMNTDTNSWCRFTGQNAVCFGLLNDRLYFGTAGGNVYLADEGYNDDGSDVPLNARQAYNYFDDGRGGAALDKHFHFLSFVLNAESIVPLSAELNINFQDDVPSYTVAVTPGGAEWDVAEWDVADWSGQGEVQTVTATVGKIGYAASPWLRITTNDVPIEWYATRIVYERLKGIGPLI